jgi:hypothetical protein
MLPTNVASVNHAHYTFTKKAKKSVFIVILDNTSVF